MSRTKIEVIDTGNIGIYADFGSDSEDEDWERKQIGKKDEEIWDFVKCHPMPSPYDEEGFKFWMNVGDRLMNEEIVDCIRINTFRRYDITKKMYEHLTDKKLIIECGKELNNHRSFDAMIINPTLLSMAMDELNDTNKPCLRQIRVIEHWWDGIGNWKA